MSTIVVTGASKGIGLALVGAYVNRSDEVVAVCRSSNPELVQTGAEIIESVDVSNDGEVSALSDLLDGRRIDVLINNAGVALRSDGDEDDWSAMLRQFDVNALGPLRVTRALLDNLMQGSKVVIITSFMGSIGQNSWGGQYGYRMSKAAANMGGVTLSHELKSRNVPVLMLHPGYVKTDLTAGQGSISPEKSANGIVKRIDELTMSDSGRFLNVDGQEMQW